MPHTYLRPVILPHCLSPPCNKAEDDYTPIYWFLGFLTASLIFTVIVNNLLERYQSCFRRRHVSNASLDSGYQEIPGDTLDHVTSHPIETQQEEPN